MRKTVQAVFSVFFVIFTIGAGHLLMLTAEHYDMKISSAAYRTPGAKASWHGDIPLTKECEKKIAEAKRKGNSRNLRLYESSREEMPKGESLSFRMLPVSPFIVWCTMATGILSLFLLVFSKLLIVIPSRDFHKRNRVLVSEMLCHLSIEENFKDILADIMYVIIEVIKDFDALFF